MVRLGPPLGGVLVVDKPRGPTSHDVVARVRRALGRRDVGHAGTLDPMASGVLVVALGEATKLVPYLTAEEKSYDATIALGAATDTLDADGAETERVAPSAELLAALGDPASPVLEAALRGERERVMQVPPAFSAIKQAGVRAYAMARRGDAPELPPRPVRVVELRVTGARVAPPALDVAMTASKGYYVRALARDLAAALGTVGHLTSLRRTRSGSFTLEDAAPLDTPDLASRVVPLALAAARALPVARLTEAGARDARHGRAVAAAEIAAASTQTATTRAHAWLDAGGALVAIGEIDEAGVGRVLRGFANEAATSS